MAVGAPEKMPVLSEDQLAELRDRVARFRADKSVRLWTLDEILAESTTSC